MKLVKFCVTNFRSVKDSGWLDVDAVTALIGVNESGKTNLLLPLWKLNPVRDGELQPTSDYPKTMFGEIRDAPENYEFVTAQFECAAQAPAFAKLAGLPVGEADLVQVTRFYDGEYNVSFPKHSAVTKKPKAEISAELSALKQQIAESKSLKSEEGVRDSIVAGLDSLSGSLGEADALGGIQMKRLITGLEKLIPQQPAKTSVIVPMLQQLIAGLTDEHAKLTAPSPGDREGVEAAVLAALPKLVYFSNYGNLDSEIYLPHVVENLKRTDLGAKEAAKARTLRVLFKFVKLEPQEILDLGKEELEGRKPTAEEIDEVAEAKRTRSILLQSAGATLTERFRDWWKQGDYRFRFEADGNHFRIWVSDQRRVQEVELENRSTGLQWFLSFYLVFLVESMGEHKNAILLLDEPGMSLHPLAQRDLSAFFDSLSNTNQIVYTSHSPFLVDADRLDRARKVYVSGDGTTKATPDLRYIAGEEGQAGASYAVYSALNLNVAESLLLGCQPVIVEGPSDQHYLTAIKSLLVSSQRIAPIRELVFPPSGGSKTARVIAAILTGRDDKLPVILLDSDGPGRRMANDLTSGLYAGENQKILSVAEFVGFDHSEIEDLFPPEFLADEVDRMEKGAEARLADQIKQGVPFVGQVEAWAKDQKVVLNPHWKVELAKRVKQRALTVGAGKFSAEVLDRWKKLFDAFAERAGT